jgi:hypothetical protein
LAQAAVAETAAAAVADIVAAALVEIAAAAVETVAAAVADTRITRKIALLLKIKSRRLFKKNLLLFLFLKSGCCSSIKN